MANRQIVFTAEQEADIVAMYKAGVGWNEIQKRHEIHSASTLKRVLKDNGIDVTRGANHCRKVRNALADTLHRLAVSSAICAVNSC